MLRASIDFGSQSLDWRSLGDRSVSSGSEIADALLTFTDALVGRDDTALAAARTQLGSMVGAGGIAAAAGAAGNFEMMNRILDATGVPVSPSMREVATSLM